MLVVVRERIEQLCEGDIVLSSNHMWVVVFVDDSSFYIKNCNSSPLDTGLAGPYLVGGDNGRHTYAS